MEKLNQMHKAEVVGSQSKNIKSVETTIKTSIGNHLKQTRNDKVKVKILNRTISSHKLLPKKITLEILEQMTKIRITSHQTLWEVLV